MAFAGVGVLAVGEQVADIQQLQAPAIALGLQPATGVQGAGGKPLEVEVEDLPLPVGGAAFDDYGTVGTQVVQQRYRLLRGGVFDQAMAQGAVDVQDTAKGVQVDLQAGAGGHQGWCYMNLGRAAEEAIEELFPRGQNCRLAWAVSVVGRLGTVPKPGSTRNGNTLLRFAEG